MTLLAAITSAAATHAPAAGARIVFTPGDAPPHATSSALPTPIPPSVWTLTPAHPELETAASSLAASLSSSPSPSRLRTLLSDFLNTLVQSLALAPHPTRSLLDAIRDLAPYIPAAVASLVASAAGTVGAHDVLLALADARILPHPPPGLITTLCDGGRADLLCAVLRQATDLRASELLAALRFFLSPASDEAYDAMVGVKSRWKDAAVLAVSNFKQNTGWDTVGIMVRRTAVLLMMGHDGFASPEVCLHYLLASGNVDSVVLGAAVADLDGGEVISLIRYLNKWIAKYRRFPEAWVYPETKRLLKYEHCETVPPLGAVVRALGVVLDNHFSHLVLNADVREELRAADVMVRELAMEAESSGPILDLLRRLH